jgi:cytoskeleton protein RodZ
MNDQPDILDPNPIGRRLKAAREEKGISLDDVANKTRVPIRHLQHIEAGEWDALPAPTYSVGFARSYANAIGLNGSEIGAELRQQLGTGQRNSPVASYFEPADPARVPPRSLALIAGAIALLLVVGYMIWRSGTVDDTDVQDSELAAAVDSPIVPVQPQAPAAPAPAAGAPSAAGPVVLTATGDVWMRIYQADGQRLHEATMKAGDVYQVPPSARQPMIVTGRPNALRVTVGQTVIPPLGEPERTISDVSLAPADLVARLQTSAAAAPPTAAPVQQPSGR